MSSVFPETGSLLDHSEPRDAQDPFGSSLIDGIRRSLDDLFPADSPPSQRSRTVDQTHNGGGGASASLAAGKGNSHAQQEFLMNDDAMHHRHPMGNGIRDDPGMQHANHLHHHTHVPSHSHRPYAQQNTQQYHFPQQHHESQQFGGGFGASMEMIESMSAGRMLDQRRPGSHNQTNRNPKHGDTREAPQMFGATVQRNRSYGHGHGHGNFAPVHQQQQYFPDDSSNRPTTNNTGGRRMQVHQYQHAARSGRQGGGGHHNGNSNNGGHENPAIAALLQVLGGGPQTNSAGTTTTYPSLDHLTPALLRGRISQLAKDQYMCMFLQMKIQEGSNIIWRDAIYQEIYDILPEIMKSKFGNYLFSKLFEYATFSQRAAMIRRTAADIVSISIDEHGTWAVQKMIQFLMTPSPVGQTVSAALVPILGDTSSREDSERALRSAVVVFVNALKGHVVSLVKHFNGNHAIAKCLEHLPPEDNQFIYDAISGRAVEVATHQQGCIVLQRCIHFANEDRRIQLGLELAVYAVELAQHEFANYAIQFVVALQNAVLTKEIVSKFYGHIHHFCVHRFASHVVEKALEFSGPAVRSVIIGEMIENILQLIRDPYGNYVIQKALTLCDPSEFELLASAIRPKLQLIRNKPYGEKLDAIVNKQESNNSGDSSRSRPRRNAAGKRPHLQQTMLFVDPDTPPPSGRHHANAANPAGIFGIAHPSEQTDSADHSLYPMMYRSPLPYSSHYSPASGSAFADVDYSVPASSAQHALPQGNLHTHRDSSCETDRPQWMYNRGPYDPVNKASNDWGGPPLASFLNPSRLAPVPYVRPSSASALPRDIAFARPDAQFSKQSATRR
eukprot:ANDGO_03908.mRNA.1 Pumilio domain-containing protein C6G9.14